MPLVEIGTKYGGEKFSAVVTLETTDGGVKLHGDKGKESKKCIACVKFSSEGKDPCKVREIIDNNKIKFITRTTNNWGGP
jgi:hypothetical protein